jgi:hypothetical protein
MNDYFVSSITYSILPPLIASSLQNLLYSNNILPRQHPQSHQFQRDRRLIYTILVLAFLFYTTYTAYTGLSPTYYDLLGVSTAATPSELRSQFKILYLDSPLTSLINRSKSLHPDKSTTSNGAFLAIRHAYQILLNHVKRKAYDLFGPIISQWDLRSEREFLFRGVCWGVLPRYLISFLMLQVWGLFGRNGQVKYVIREFYTKANYSGDTSFSLLYLYSKSIFSYMPTRRCWDTSALHYHDFNCFPFSIVFRCP